VREETFLSFLTVSHPRREKKTAERERESRERKRKPVALSLSLPPRRKALFHRKH
jgi:hypothetical protein